MYGIADLDNCCVSCERVFRPDLQGVPVVVLLVISSFPS